MLRAESQHLDATLHALVERLSSVPGVRLSVSGLRLDDQERPGLIRRLLGDLPYVNDLYRGDDPVREIVVSLGGQTYWLHSNGGSLECGRGAAPAEAMPFAQWAAELFDEIDRENLTNHDSMVALRRLVEDDRLS